MALLADQRFQLGQARLIAAERRVGLRHDLEGVAEQIEIVDEGRAEISLKGAEHRAVGHAQDLRLAAVDVGEDARRLGVEGDERARNHAGLVRRVRQRLCLSLQGLWAVATLILDDHLEATGRADAAHRRRLDDFDVGVGDVPRPAF